MEHSIKTNNFSVIFEITDHCASIKKGIFGDITLLRSPIFSATIERLSDKEEFCISSESNWQNVTINNKSFIFNTPESYGDITFILTPKADKNGISWFTEIKNCSEEYSVISVDYPIPKVTADNFNMFVPSCSGRVIADIGNIGFKMKDTYPHHYSSMQYFAYYGKASGIYLGIHEKDACMKDFIINAENGTSDLTVRFFAIGAGQKANCFSLGGYVRWEFFSGDWFDATMIYKSFVHQYAKWLPKIDENGRLDTPQKIKDIAYWIVEYMPNSPEQRDVRPKKLGAVSHLYGKDYWFEAPIELQKRLNVPIGYHIYNWHNNPFNINYPHFTPKDEYYRGLAQLKGKDINVMPYINGVSWETHDADEGFDINFENTGKYGAALDKWGNPITVSYPQKKVNGEDTQLSPMCPSFPQWREIVKNLARKLENEMDVDGIYFDEIAAHNPHPCRSEKHGHLPGGGSYWTDGYNELMDIVKYGKKDNVFYVSESSGEPYMKSFDGYLTWLWRQPDDVPAFSAIYAGYIVMLGRFSDGIDKKDDAFFRQNIAKALLYGQQPGWLFADVVYDNGRMEFLEKFVKMRYKHTNTFCSCTMLRPPKTNNDNIMSAGWKKRNGNNITLFVANLSDKETDYSVSFDRIEYGIDLDKLPKNAVVHNDTVTLTGKIPAFDVIDLNF